MPGLVASGGLRYDPKKQFTAHAFRQFLLPQSAKMTIKTGLGPRLMQHHSAMKDPTFVTTLEHNRGSSLPLEARFLVAGSVWLVTTNAAEILAAARETFQPANNVVSPFALTISCYVDSKIREEKPWPQPHFRGLDHLVYASYGPGSSMLIDLRLRRVIGMFSPAMACDLNYWKSVLLPVLLGVTSASVGITPLHCACLVKDGRGLILGGASGAGKSTLAVSLSLNKFSYLSDDWTYFSQSDSRVYAWGLPTSVKLLPDTVKFFPGLASAKLARSLNGELAYEVDPVEVFGVNRSLCCEPQWLVFVERSEEARAVFEPITSEDAFARFARELEALPSCISDTRIGQLRTIKTLVSGECWVLRHGLTPARIAEELSEFCAA